MIISIPMSFTNLTVFCFLGVNKLFSGKAFKVCNTSSTRTNNTPINMEITGLKILENKVRISEKKLIECSMHKCFD